MRKPRQPLSLENLRGQQRQVAEALLAYGYLDKEFALLNLKIRSLGEIVRRLRLKGWPILTNENAPQILYTLSRDVKKDVRLITTAINAALNLGNLRAAHEGAKSLSLRLQKEIEGKAVR
jgi:hypothetical protein